MTDSFVKRWQTRRAIGKQKYVLRYGFMVIGLTATLLFTISDLGFNGDISFTYLLGRLVMFPSVGALIAGMMWERNEKKYARLISSRSS